MFRGGPPLPNIAKTRGAARRPYSRRRITCYACGVTTQRGCAFAACPGRPKRLAGRRDCPPTTPIPLRAYSETSLSPRRAVLSLDPHNRIHPCHGDEIAYETRTMPPRKKKVAEGSQGLAADEVTSAKVPAEVTALAEQIARDGGTALAQYRDPYGGQWLVLAALPLAKVSATPYQRELSKTHADRLAGVIPKVGRYLDPIVA